MNEPWMRVLCYVIHPFPYLAQVHISAGYLVEFFIHLHGLVYQFIP